MIFNRNKLLLLRIFLIFLCLTATLTAQSGALRIVARLLQQNVRVFFLSDFNFVGGSGSSPLIFDLTMTNPVNVMRQVKLELRVESDHYGLLAQGSTDPFWMQPLEIIPITNQNLFQQAQKFTLKDFSIESAVEDLRDRILATGRLPADIYRFRFIISEVNGTDQASDVIEIDVTNPTTVDLITPGGRVEDSELGQIFSSLPQFRWESNAELFKITVAEKLPGFHDQAAPEEIMNDRIRLQKYIRVIQGSAGALSFGPDTIVTRWNFFQYPSSGVFPLERGKTYYWQIMAYISAAGGTVELPSEIWGFRIATGPADLLNPEQQQILDYLVSILGQGFLESFQSSGGDLEGFLPTGVVLKNGQILSRDDLLAFIKRFRDGDITVVSVYVQ